jgi:serine protease Do
MYQSVDRGTGSSAPGQDTTIMDVVKTAENSVVEIMTESPTMGNFFNQFITDGGGSGVVLTEDGYILTNNHVVEDADKITVRLKNGQTYDAALIGKDAKTDIAVLKIKPSEKLVPVVFGNSDNIAVGEKAIVIGNPLGELGGTVTDGIISALDREIRISGQTMTLLQTNADINPGNSGGGLFNTKGELIGIVNAKYASTELEGLGFAIPSNLAKNAASELIDIGYISGRPAIGVTLVDIQDYRTAMYYNVEEFGVYIMEVLPGSGAEKAGLRQGDRIVSINGEETLQYSDIEAFLRGASVGAQVKVGIDRNGESITKNVTLGEMKPSAE